MPTIKCNACQGHIVRGFEKDHECVIMGNSFADGAREFAKYLEQHTKSSKARENIKRLLCTFMNN